MKKHFSITKGLALIVAVCVFIGTIPLAGDTWNKWFPLPSLHPLYTEADLVFLPELVGAWQEDGGDSTLIFEKFESSGILGEPGDTGYILIIEVSGRKSLLEARLLRLGDELFLDLSTSSEFEAKAFEGEIYQPILPVHAFGRVRIEGDVLRVSTLQGLSFLSLTDEYQLESETVPGLPMEVIKDGLVLSATTEQLQEFVLQHLDKYFSFEEDEFLRRVSPAQGEGSKKVEPESAEGNENEG